MEVISMGFGRGDVNTIIDSLGVTIPDDARENAVTQLMQLHGSTISGMKQRLNGFDSMDIEGMKRDSETLASLKSKMGTATIDEVMSTYTAVKEQLGEKKLEDVLKANAEYEATVLKEKKNTAIDSLLGEYKFTSKAAERAIRGELYGLELNKDGKLSKGDDTLQKLITENPDAFIMPKAAVKPKFSAETKANVTTNTVTEQQAYLERLKKRFG